MLAFLKVHAFKQALSTSSSATDPVGGLKQSIGALNDAPPKTCLQTLPNDASKLGMARQVEYCSVS